VRAGASTPEELESLFEDALLVGDREGLARLFEEAAVLVARHGAIEVNGGDEIARSATAMSGQGFVYVADPQHVVQARSTGLVVSERAVNVVRRGADGRWRYAISLLDDHPTEGGAR